MSSQPDVATIDYKGLERSLQKAENDAELFKLIVNSPFDKANVQMAFLFLGIIVLLLVNKKTGMIDRVALSETDLAKRTTEVSVIPFEKIKISADNADNIIAKAIRSSQMQDTTDWKYLFTPSLTPAQARINQANAGIAYSAVCPLSARDGGALIFSYYQYKELVGEDQQEFMAKYAQLVSDSLKPR